jgi:hypothetical protein
MQTSKPVTTAARAIFMIPSQLGFPAKSPFIIQQQYRTARVDRVAQPVLGGFFMMFSCVLDLSAPLRRVATAQIAKWGRTVG